MTLKGNVTFLLLLCFKARRWCLLLTDWSRWILKKSILCRPSTVFETSCWLYCSFSFRTGPAEEQRAEGSQVENKGSLQTTVSPARPRRRENPIKLIISARPFVQSAVSQKEEKNKWVPFWKRPNCVWTAIKPLKVECQTV